MGVCIFSILFIVENFNKYIMGHHNYEDAIKGVYKGLFLLAAVTLVEVFFSLAGKGYIPGLGFLEEIHWLVYVIGAVLIILSLYKAYFIVYEFMHMGSEVRGLRLTVVMPMLLLVWAVIAFFQEGGAWKNRRDVIKQRNEIKTIDTAPMGSAIKEFPINDI